MVFVHVDMAPSLIDMRPGATTGRSRCHKPDPLVIATGKFFYVIERIEPWSMTDTDRTEVYQFQIIVIHTA